jgi:hypothetical protein
MAYLYKRRPSANRYFYRRANLREQVQLKGSDVVCMYTDLTRLQLYRFISCNHSVRIDGLTARMIEARLQLPDGSLDAKPADGGCALHKLLEDAAKLDEEGRLEFMERLNELTEKIERKIEERPKH